MNPEDVLKVIREVSAMLEPAAQRVWALAIRESYIRGIRAAISALLCAALCAIAYKIILQGLEKSKKKVQYSSDDGTAEFMIGGAIVALCAPGFAMALDVALKFFLNPEFHAILVLMGK